MDAPKSYYLYNPSEPLAGVVAGLYGMSFCITLWQIIRKKAWWRSSATQLVSYLPPSRQRKDLTCFSSHL
ncbi:hypothetical protein LB505_007341 [Fusarium chuoi]|nr:hypothetical protein LB505_007341 [Fusarium chuoi]